MARIAFQAKEYASAAEMIASYSAIRKTYRTVLAPAQPIVEPEPVIAEPEPVIEKPPAPAPPAPPVHLFSSGMSDVIKRKVAEHFKVTGTIIDSRNRTKEAVKPRHIAIAIVKRMTTLSLPQIGHRFGGRDHTTVLYAVRKLDPLVEAIWREQPDASINDRIAALDVRTDVLAKPLPS